MEVYMCVANDPASFSEFPSLGLFARKLAELPGPSGTPSGKFQGLGVGAEEQGGPFAAWGLYSMSQFFFYSGLSTATDHLLLYVSVATWLPPGLSVQCSDRRIEPGLSVKL